MKTPYNDKFYRKRHERTLHAAETVLSIVAEFIPTIRSAVDVGCGVGTWLSVLKKKGVEDIQGVDGNWVDKRFLVIPEERFMEHDLSKGLLRLTRRYDLAISLEVAEHLPPESARDFVATLTALSDFVLFSAAIPHQRGAGHINEQWPDYWASLFKDREYAVFDVIRHSIWSDEMISTCYKQNILLFVREQCAAALRSDKNSSVFSFPLRIVHPTMHMSTVTYSTSLHGSLKLVLAALKGKVFSRHKASR